MNPFANRNLSLAGPATDAHPVTPDDANDLTDAAIALYVETGGTIVLDTVANQTRTIAVSDFAVLPLGTKRVRATGTTATGIHALLLV